MSTTTDPNEQRKAREAEQDRLVREYRAGRITQEQLDSAYMAFLQNQGES